MHVVLLGTAAGGGFPQWNCRCPSCRVARTDPQRAVPRTQSSAAVSADGKRWFLLNASPDVREQVARLSTRPPEGLGGVAGEPPTGTSDAPGEPPAEVRNAPGESLSAARYTPIEGIVLTDAELDHTLGLVLLREGKRLQLYATCAVQAILEFDSRFLPVTRAFADVETVELQLRSAVPLRYLSGESSGLSVETFTVPAGPPRFAVAEQPGHTVGLIVTDAGTGSRCAFVPGCGDLDADLLARFEETDLLLFDGTFWSDDELVRLGISDRRAREMDHLPISGADGSLARLATLTRPWVVYMHLNNTNPVLIEDSSERAQIEAAEIVVGTDGMQFSL